MEENEQEVPDPIMAYGARFRRNFTMTELVENYDGWKRVQHEEAKRIKASSEARKFIIKNIGKKDPYELLTVACRCIADLTSDRYFKDFAETIKTGRSEDK